jgi:hypothetical protein
MNIDDIDTPAVIIDLDKVAANLAAAQNYADQHGLALRPHVKTHKLARFAQDQIGLGAIGITAQKLGEAEDMANGGINDIFLPYNILGAAKLNRLLALHNRVKLSVTADSSAVVDGYETFFKDPGNPLAVLVECDTGAGRCGVSDARTSGDIGAGDRYGTGFDICRTDDLPAARQNDGRAGISDQRHRGIDRCQPATCDHIKWWHAGSDAGCQGVRRHRVSSGHLHLRRPNAGCLGAWHARKLCANGACNSCEQTYPGPGHP